MRACIYCRVGSPENAEETLVMQRDALIKYARERGWSTTVVAMECAAGTRLEERPSLDKIRAAASKNEFDVLLIKDPSRLARGAVLMDEISRELKSHSIRLHSAQDREFFDETPFQELREVFQGFAQSMEM